MMETLGAGVIDSDELAHKELDRAEVLASLASWWGAEVVNADGSANRRKIAAIVFNDPKEKRRLEALLHPRIARRRDEIMAQMEASPDIRMIVIDAPLLYEAALDSMCDAVIFVESDRGERLRRLLASRQWTEDDLVQREKNQMPLDAKRARADYICENNSSLDDLRGRVAEIFKQVAVDGGGL